MSKSASLFCLCCAMSRKKKDGSRLRRKKTWRSIWEFLLFMSMKLFVFITSCINNGPVNATFQFARPPIVLYAGLKMS